MDVPEHAGSLTEDFLVIPKEISVKLSDLGNVKHNLPPYLFYVTYLCTTFLGSMLLLRQLTTINCTKTI